MAASSRLQATDFLHEIAIPAWFRLERPTNHARTGRCRLRLYTQEGGIADWRSSKTSKAVLTVVDTGGIGPPALIPLFAHIPYSRCARERHHIRAKPKDSLARWVLWFARLENQHRRATRGNLAYALKTHAQKNPQQRVFLTSAEIQIANFSRLSF